MNRRERISRKTRKSGTQPSRGSIFTPQKEQQQQTTKTPTAAIIIIKNNNILIL